MQRLELMAYGLAAVTAAVVAACWFGGPGDQELLFALKSKPNLDSNQLVIQATNSASTAMTIVGCESSCSCGYVTGLPISIPSGESVDLGLVLSSSYFDDDPLEEMVITFFLDGSRLGKQEVIFQIREFFDRHGSSMSK